MSSNQDQIIDRYGDGGREAVRSGVSRTSSLEFTYTKKHLEGFITKETKVLEVGCATGHYGLYYADKCKSYFGVDICPSLIERFQAEITERKLANLTCQVGDATYLHDLADGSFDVVLCLGPMYHLPSEERDLVFSECKRVCRAGGIVAFAYMNQIGVYAGACVLYDDMRYPNELANDRILNQFVDDINPDTFFYTTPEAIEEVAKRHKLSIIKNLATDYFVMRNIINAMDENQYKLMKPLMDQMTSHASCTGMSNHALLVCRN